MTNETMILQALGGDPVVVLRSPDLPLDALHRLNLAEATVHDLARAPMSSATVVLAAPDALSLRRAASALPELGTGVRIGCWLADGNAQLLSLVPRPEWPALASVVAERRPECFVLSTFEKPVRVRAVLVEIARGTTGHRLLAPGWPVLGARQDEPHRWPPGDPGAVVVDDPPRLDDTDGYPPDVFVTDTDLGTDGQDAHAALGRPPAAVMLGPELTWEALAELGPGESETQLTRAGHLSLGGLDDRVLNPVGFARRASGHAVPLRPHPGATHVLTLAAPGADISIDTRRGLSAADLPSLREVPGVHTDWSGGAGPQAYSRAVASLAMCGTPLTCEEAPDWARALLHPELLAALESPVVLTDPLSREEHSVRVRRAALRHHAAGPWRRALGERTGQQTRRAPRVSVLLATRRPWMLRFALHQVARQQGADIELILAAHGFSPDPIVVRECAGSVPVTVVEVPETTVFGAALNLAAERACGDVLLKMDDDDWYGTDFVSDLLLARAYSGADLVGSTAEFIFVEPLWATVRRHVPSERYRPVVAGGTMMVEHDVFWSLGGFRAARKYVDASLLSALRDAGGTVYRTHGLGYVLRRSATGHTWDPGVGFFVQRAQSWDQWRGFRPSELLSVDAHDLPTRGASGDPDGPD